MTRKPPTGRAYDRYDGPALEIEEGAQLHTVDVGAVAVGVSYRVVTPELVEASGLALPNHPGSLEDEGISIHIFERSTGHEYLRFDCFEEDPHYHYLVPEGYIYNVGFDPVANGDMARWVIHTLESRLTQMLEVAGATHLAEAANPREVARAAEELHREAVARAA